MTAGGSLAPQAVEQAAVSGLDDFPNFGGEVVADAGQTRCQVLALVQQRARFLRQFAQHARRVAVGADAERIGALDFKPVGYFLEGGDVGVVGRHWFESYSGRSCAHCPAQETAHLDARQTRLSASPACPNRRGAAGVDFTHPAAVPARAARRPRSPKRGGAPNASFRADGSA